MSKIKPRQKMAEPSNVVSMNRAVTVEPLEGWKLHTKHGYMRRGPDAGDRLVRLHDVAAWLMSERELPLVLAVDAVCSALDANGLEGVYMLCDNEYAHWIGEPSPFDKYFNDDTLSKRIRSVWLMRPFELERLVNAPGHEPAYVAEEKTPFEFFGTHGGGAGDFAVTLDKAHELWGWGRAVALQDVAEAAPKSDATEWTPERLWDALSKLEGDGRGAPMKRLAEMAGIRDREIRRQLEPFRAVAKLKTSGFGGLIRQAKPHKKRG